MRDQAHRPTSARRATPSKSSPEAVSARRRELGRKDPGTFAKVYLPHLLVAQNDIFDKDPDENPDAEVLIPAGTEIGFSEFHSDLFGHCNTDSSAGLRLGYIAPRGFAKSTAITIVILWWAAYKLREFVLWTSETASQVEELMASMIDEVETNPALVQDFPHMQPKRDARKQTVKWTDRDILMQSGFRCSARGAQKSTRGLRRGAKRPDVLICDDAEGENTVGDTQFPKVRRWLTRVVGPALAPRGDIIWVNTLIDWTSVTGAMIRGDEDWTKKWRIQHLQAEWWEAPDGRRVDVATLTYHEPQAEYHGTPYAGGTDENPLDGLVKRLLWPEYWPQERLDAFKAEFGALAYSFEMLNKPMSEGDKVFRDPDWLKFASFEGDYIFREGVPRDDWINANLLTYITAIDPAFGGKDYAAVVTVGFFQHDFFVREAWWARGQGIRTEQVEQAVKQAEKWGSRAVIVEAVAAQIMVADETMRKGRVPVIPIHPGGKSKVDRALPVAVRASQSHVYFESGIPSLRALVEILRQFPGALADDPVDATVYAIEGGAGMRSKFLVVS